MWTSMLIENLIQYGLKFSILALIIVVAYFALERKVGAGGEPPGPRGLPIVGYLPFLGPELHHEFGRLSKIYGPIYKLWLGSKPCFVLSSPELAKEVVRDQDVVFANRELTVAAKVGSHGGNDIAFGSYGSEWKKLRKVFVREMLSNKILDNMYGLRREEVHKSLKQIYQTINTPVDIGRMAFETTVNAFMNMTCATSLPGKDADKFNAAVSELMVLFGRPNVSDLFPILARFDLQGIEWKTKKVMGVIEDVLDSCIELRRKTNNEILSSDHHAQELMRKDFLQSLLEIHDATSSISMNQMKALLQDTLVGGTETTATMIEWTMAELIKHPEAMTRLQQELTQVVGPNNLVEESHLPQLTYLNAVVKETHRLHPALPLLVPRRPSETTTVGGFKVPRDAKIFLNVLAIHTDPEIWTDPLEFKPERFLNEGKVLDYSGNNFHLMPFGAGRRICPGITLAEKVLSHVVASFVHCFEWKFPRPLAELEMSDKFGIVVKKLEPLVAIPAPRFSNVELFA